MNWKNVENIGLFYVVYKLNKSNNFTITYEQLRKDFGVLFNIDNIIFIPQISKNKVNPYTTRRQLLKEVNEDGISFFYKDYTYVPIKSLIEPDKTEIHYKDSGIEGSIDRYYDIQKNFPEYNWTNDYAFFVKYSGASSWGIFNPFLMISDNIVGGDGICFSWIINSNTVYDDNIPRGNNVLFDILNTDSFDEGWEKKIPKKYLILSSGGLELDESYEISLMQLDSFINEEIEINVIAIGS